MQNGMFQLLNEAPQCGRTAEIGLADLSDGAPSWGASDGQTLDGVPVEETPVSPCVPPSIRCNLDVFLGGAGGLVINEVCWK